MEPLTVAMGMALWFGVLTSISPCPMATNIAAVSYIGTRNNRKSGIFLAGLFYMVGRMLTYAVLGAILVSSTQAVPMVANFLQKYMNLLLGPLLIIIGLILLNVIQFSMGKISGHLADSLQGRIHRFGLLGAFLLGILFALSFCPVSAALFFGSLFSLAARNQSSILIPSIYGIGTALPVLALSIFMGISTGLLAKAYDKMTAFDKTARKITGIIFIAAGAYYCWTYWI